MKSTGFFFDEHCFWHTGGEMVFTEPVGDWMQPLAGGGFAETPESKRRLKSLLDVSGLSEKLYTSGADPVSMDDLQRVHTGDYLKQFKDLSDFRGGDLGDCAPFSKGGYDIALLSAGLAKQAVFSVLSGQVKNAYALSRPPGHHALADHSMGFCLLNNIAIAIRAAQVTFPLKRVAVVDWDVHHGNGTQAIFYRDPSVLTISLHQENNYPLDSGSITERGEGEGEGTNVNIPLFPGAGHVSYAQAMDRVVVPLLTQFQPELIIVASGYDASFVDPLGRMMAHSETYRMMTERLMQVAAQVCFDRLVLVHEGGYAEAYVPFCGLTAIEALASTRTAVVDSMLPTALGSQPSERFNQLQKQALDEMAIHYGLR